MKRKASGRTAAVKTHTVRDAELAEVLSDSPWERMQREADADLAAAVDEAFGRMVDETVGG